MTAPLKADVTAAERLLKAAVRRAVSTYRAECRHSPAVYGALDHWCTTQERVKNMLAEAGRSAELLLSERAS